MLCEQSDLKNSVFGAESNPDGQSNCVNSKHGPKCLGAKRRDRNSGERGGKVQILCSNPSKKLEKSTIRRTILTSPAITQPPRTSLNNFIKLYRHGAEQ